MHKIVFTQKEIEEFLDLFYREYKDEYLAAHNSLKTPSGEIPYAKDVMLKLSGIYPTLYQTIIGRYIVHNDIVRLEPGIESHTELRGIDYISELRQVYEHHKTYFDDYLDSCIKIGVSGNPKLLFSTLCYNLLVVFGVNADQAKKTIQELEKNDTLFKGSEAEIQKVMEESGYRYYNIKSKLIYQNRKRFFDEDNEIPITVLIEGIGSMSPEDGRNILRAKRIGLGMKTASHFMRNIGLSHNKLAIIDSHILRKMEEYRVITDLHKKPDGSIPHPSDSQYLQYEPIIRNWSQNIVKIPLDALDLLLWHLDRHDI